MNIQIEIREELLKSVYAEALKEEMTLDETIALMLLMYLSPLTVHSEMDKEITRKLVKLCSKEERGELNAKHRKIQR